MRQSFALQLTCIILTSIDNDANKINYVYFLLFCLFKYFLFVFNTYTKFTLYTGVWDHPDAICKGAITCYPNVANIEKLFLTHLTL